MFVRRIELQLLHLMAGEAGLVGHTPDGFTKDFLWVALEHLLCGESLQAADIAGMLAIEFSFPLVAGENDLVCIENNDKITGVGMASESGFMLPDNHASDHGGESTDDLILSVNNVPFRCVWTLGLKVMGAGHLGLVGFLL